VGAYPAWAHPVADYDGLDRFGVGEVVSIFRKRKPVVNSGYQGLSDEVASYFRRLDSLGPDESLARAAERAKADLRARRRMDLEAWIEYEKSVLDKPLF
jgi:hypothetical protein